MITLFWAITYLTHQDALTRPPSSAANSTNRGPKVGFRSDLLGVGFGFSAMPMEEHGGFTSPSATIGNLGAAQSPQLRIEPPSSPGMVIQYDSRLTLPVWVRI